MFIRKEHLKIVAKIAWSFHYTTGMEFDELYAEGCLACCEAINQYKAGDNCKLTTYIYGNVKNRLINLTKRYYMISNHFQAMPSAESGWDYGENDPSHDFNNDLAKVIAVADRDVQTVVNMVLSNKEKYGLVKPKFARGQIKDDLHALGWKWERIWTAIRETKVFINEKLSVCII